MQHINMSWFRRKIIGANINNLMSTKKYNFFIFIGIIMLNIRWIIYNDENLLNIKYLLIIYCDG